MLQSAALGQYLEELVSLAIGRIVDVAKTDFDNIIAHGDIRISGIIHPVAVDHALAEIERGTVVAYKNAAVGEFFNGVYGNGGVSLQPCFNVQDIALANRTILPVVSGAVGMPDGRFDALFIF